MVDINLTEVRGILDLNSSLPIQMPPEIISKFAGLMTLIKAIGIIFIIYIVFLIVKSILGIRRNIKINKMYYKINDIDDKINLILKKHKINTKEDSPVSLNKIKRKPKK